MLQVANLAGTVTNGQVFQLFSASSRNGNFTAAVNGTNLTLAWPADHVGWTLTMQTNRLGSGLSLDTNEWTRLPGSATTNPAVIPLNPAQPSAIYRLVYP